MKKRTQIGGVNGPLNLTVVIAEKGKSEAAHQSDFATFDSTLPDERMKTRGDRAENPRMRWRRLG
jgi:hypothetical protein